MNADQLTVSGQTAAGTPAPTPAPVQRAPSIASGNAAPPVSPAAGHVDNAQIKKSVAVINEFIQPHAGSIEFSIDDTSGKTLLKIIDKETNTVLMQFPSKEALALSQNIGNLKGFLVNDTA